MACAKVQAESQCQDAAKVSLEMGNIRTTKGSHVIAQKGRSFHNLQEKKGKAKPYQVAQVRDDLKKFNFKPE